MYEANSSETCRRGLRGAFCTLCVDADEHVFNPRLQRCTPRRNSTIFLVLVVVLLVLIAVVPFCMEGVIAKTINVEHHLRRFPTRGTRWAKDKLRRAIKKIADPVKLCISFYQVIMQMGTVYRTQVPPAYQDLLMFANSIVDWLPYLDMPFNVTLAKKLFGISLVIPLISLLIFVRALLWERNLHHTRQEETTERDSDSGGRHHEDGHPLDHVRRRNTTVVELANSIAPAPLSYATEARDAFFNALPIIVWLSFFLSVPISSFAFLALRDCDCVDMIGAADGNVTQMCFLHADYSVLCPPTPSMSQNEMKLYDETRGYATLAVLIYAVGTPAAFALMLFKARKAISGAASDTRLSLALSFLYREYRTGLWFWELLISVTKQILVGFLSLSVFNPGTPMQLLIALAVTLLYTALVSWVQPYRNKGLGFLAVFASASLQFIFLTFLSLMLYEDGSSSVEDGSLYLDPAHRLAKTVFGVGELFICSLGVLVVAIFVRHVIWTQARTVHWAADNEEVRVRQPRGGKHHIFLSHAWRSGQDQAKAVKLLLVDLLPELKVFLDVDTALDRARTEGNRWMFENVRASTTLVALLTGKEGKHPTSHYFMSRACMFEMRTAIEKRKSIVLVLETDPLHGGLPLAVHRAQCRKNDPMVYEALFERLSSAYVSPTIVPWHRYVELQQVSIRLVLHAVLRAEEQRRRKDDDVWVNGDLLRQRLHLHEPSGHHLFVSESLPGASAFVAYLSDQIANRRVGVHHPEGHRPKLTTTSKLDEMHDAAFFLLYLNRDTWKGVDVHDEDGLTWRSVGTETPRGQELKISRRLHEILLERTARGEEAVTFTREEMPHHEIYTRDCNHYLLDGVGRCFMPLGTDFVDEIALARAFSIPILVVHEMREDEVWRGTPTFDTIYQATPEELRNRLYSSIALPMLNGRPDCFSPDHERACVHVILRNICRERERWQQHIQRWRAKVTLHVEPLLPQVPLRAIRQASGHLCGSKGMQRSGAGGRDKEGEAQEEQCGRQRAPTLPSRFSEYASRESRESIDSEAGGGSRRRESTTVCRRSLSTGCRGSQRDSISARSSGRASLPGGAIAEVLPTKLAEQGGRITEEEEEDARGEESGQLQRAPRGRLRSMLGLDRLRAGRRRSLAEQEVGHDHDDLRVQSAKA